MRYLKFFVIPVVACFLFALGATAGYAADWAHLYDTDGYYVIGADYYDDDTGALVVTDPGESDPFVLLTDGGWENRSSYEPTSEVLRDVAVVDENTVIVVGDNGTIYKTEDFGDSWSKSAVLSGNDFYRIEMYNDTYGWVVGASGVIYKTSDGGDTWSVQGSGVSDDLQGVQFITSSIGYVVGDSGTFLMTIDGGSTWSDQSLGGDDILDIHMINVARGFMATEAGLYKTTNSGVLWSAVSGLESENFSSFDFSSSSVGAVVGLGVAYTTDDEGTTWTAVDLPDDDLMYILYDVISASDGVKIAGFASDGMGVFFTEDSAVPGSISGVVTNSPTQSTTIELSWDAATDDVAVDHYELDEDGGGYVEITQGWDTDYSFTVTEGEYEMNLRAVDFVGNAGDAVTFDVVSDQTAPMVSSVTPISATEGEVVSLRVTAVDDLLSVTCTLYLNGVSQGTMADQGGGIHAMSYTFAADGSYSAYAVCEDEVGNSKTGSTSSVTVGTASTESGTSEATESGTETSYTDDTSSGFVTDLADLDTEVLIKTMCIGSTSVNDPCRAVYYYDGDGVRHAFPNSKVYFTWFDDFDDVILVDVNVMSEIALGSNVTYHPGTRMVKFQTVNTVYAVERGGVLRAIASEDIATDLYGADWNQQIDDISDAFFSNYSFGDDIDDAGDYDVDDAQASVSSLEDNF